MTWKKSSILTLGGFHVAGKILLRERERVEFAVAENLTEPANTSKMQNCHCQTRVDIYSELCVKSGISVEKCVSGF